MHDHNHEHSHDHTVDDSPERQLALLNYMLDHNQHHAEELHELGHKLEGEASDLIHDAVDLFAQGNEKLQAALSVLKGE